MIKVLKTVDDIKKYRDNLKGSVGFVPTMGALHAGHASLLKEARLKCDHVILSIFVNPTQFNDPNDLDKYPRTFEADYDLAHNEKVDAIFYPQYKELYPDLYNYEVLEKKWSPLFCGAHRLGHFNGVLTVVLKLFNLVQADFAFFGEKDFQQLKLIEGMTEAFFLKTKIIPVATVRESDGLALSSRNVRLTLEERQRAPLFYRSLIDANSANEAHRQLEQLGFKVDYVEDWDDRRLGAIHIGTVRLIDNVKIAKTK